MFKTRIRKILVSISFPRAILGPEMVAPIFCAPGIFGFFLLDNPHAHKIPRFRGSGGVGVFWKGRSGSANFIFMGAGIFLKEPHVLEDSAWKSQTSFRAGFNRE